MLKTVMLVSALAISAPVLAQDMAQTPQKSKSAKQASAETPTAETATDPAATPQEVPAATTAQTTPQTTPMTDPTTAPAEQAAAPAPATTPETAPAQTATATPTDPAAPVTGATQIAQVVNTEFPTYDKNADTNLDKTEFTAWMVALKTASDPATKAGDPATVKWIDGAFASADVDKSTVVSKAELTAYLSQGAG